MNHLALDSTAVLSLCVDHPHRDPLVDLFMDSEVVSASALALTEVLAGIDRITDSSIDRGDLEDEVRLLWDQVHVVPIDTACLEDAAVLLRQRPLRLSDAIHLSAAVRLGRGLTWATHDPVQIAVAEGLGLGVWSPTS
ncbi:MAG: type II toxin-antitoxin system VapC family toxin [Ilumatobacteraceae bacterium]